MSNIVDKNDILKAFRKTILDAEQVDIIATGRREGIRDGDYNPSLHTRPAAPDKTAAFVTIA